MPRPAKQKEEPAPSVVVPTGTHTGPAPVPLVRNGKMALMLAGAEKALSKPKDDMFVQLDSSTRRTSMPHVPTGSIVIDYLIGGEPNQFGVAPCPGLPRGRITQVWGHESSGKSTLALTAAATVCARGGTVVYIDWEHEIVPDYAAALGVPIHDPNLFQLSQPQTLEEGVKIAMIAAVAGIDLIIFDSVGAAVPQRIANRDLADVGEQAKVGDLQQVWSQELAALKPAIARKHTAVLAISQIRAIIATGPGAGRGPTTKPQGGNAWKFYSSVRLELRRIKDEKINLFNALTHKTDERVNGGVILCKVVKCKLSKSQGRQEVFYLRWGEGIDDVRSVMEIAIAHGLINKGGSWLSWTAPSGEIKAQGVNQFREKLLKNPSDFTALYTAVLPYLGQSKISDDDLADLDEAFSSEDGEPEGPDKSEVDDLLAQVTGIAEKANPKPVSGDDDNNDDYGDSE